MRVRVCGARVLEQQASDALVVAERELDRATATWERMKKDLARAQSLSEQELVDCSTAFSNDVRIRIMCSDKQKHVYF